MSTRITADQDDLFPTTTHAAVDNIPACRQAGQTVDLYSEGSEETAEIVYIVPWDEVPNYVPDSSATHPDFPNYRIKDVSVIEDRKGDGCATLTEVYSLLTPASESLPQTTYALRTASNEQPIVQNPRFWKTYAQVDPVTGIVTVDPMSGEPNLGEIADWAKPACIDVATLTDAQRDVLKIQTGIVKGPGFVGDRSDSIFNPQPVGMKIPNKDSIRNAFEAGHPKYGINTFLETGAEWICTSYQLAAPNQDDLENNNVIQIPDGFGNGPSTSVDARQWLRLAPVFTEQEAGGYWQKVTTWRYARYGWDKHVYANSIPANDPLDGMVPTPPPLA